MTRWLKLSSILLAVELLVMAGGSSVFAKKIRIEWKSLEGAELYEMEIHKEGRILMTQKIEDPVWKGDLPYGVYSYRVRGMDRVKRMGLWSKMASLIVMPKSPEAISPEDGRQFDLYDPNATLVLKWQKVPGFNSYTLYLHKNQKPYWQTQIAGNQIELKGLPPGNYSWSLAVLVDRPNRSPGSQGGPQVHGKWESEAKKQGEFQVSYKRLPRPTLVDPIGMVSPPESGVIRLRWKPIEGAALYEVHLARLRLGSQTRNPASLLGTVKRLSTSSTSMLLRVSGEGNYVWGVRALANKGEDQVPQAIGPESVGQFKLDRNVVFNGDQGYVAFSWMLAPYSYQVNSPAASGGGSTDSWATVFRLSGEYYFHPQWGLSAAAEHAAYTIQNQDFSRESFELLARHRWKLSSHQEGWTVSPKLGVEVREYNEIVVRNNDVSNGLTEIHPFFWGISAGVDIRTQFSQRLGVGVKTGYFLPMGILGGPPGATLGEVARYSNLSTGVQGIYWLNRHWALGVGAFYDLRAVSFSLPGVPGPDEVHMDATYFFGSIIYRF